MSSQTNSNWHGIVRKLLDPDLEGMYAISSAFLKIEYAARILKWYGPWVR